ncbi:MAG: CRISPR-associated endonuclease Cas2 [Candidatus Nitrosocaldus sp.]|nr:CRISPR-associated endonuclease Cas2 [Candidatus Nitrosocaldus sp.]MDW8275656.1 CRISPR-associated endonuclease Cas2 [Candidatus Nitrosocaldus sp.]
MKVVVVYDVSVERINDVRKVLKQYLSWVQNSAFEGELSEGMLEELRSRLYEVIDPAVDSIIVYTVSNPRWMDRRIWGIEKGSTENIL